jgi:hypothetical protein
LQKQSNLDFNNAVYSGASVAQAQQIANKAYQQNLTQLYKQGLISRQVYVAAQKIGGSYKVPASAMPKPPKANYSLSSRYGYLVDGSGQPILDAKGQKQMLPPPPAKAKTPGKWTFAPEWISKQAGVIMGYAPNGALQPVPKAQGGGAYKPGAGAVPKAKTAGGPKPPTQTSALTGIKTADAGAGTLARKLANPKGSISQTVYVDPVTGQQYGSHVYVDPKTGNTDTKAHAGWRATVRTSVSGKGTRPPRQVVWKAVYAAWSADYFRYYRAMYPNAVKTPGAVQKLVNKAIDRALRSAGY